MWSLVEKALASTRGESVYCTLQHEKIRLVSDSQFNIGKFQFVAQQSGFYGAV